MNLPVDIRLKHVAKHPESHVLKVLSPFDQMPGDYRKFKMQGFELCSSSEDGTSKTVHIWKEVVP